MITLIFLTLMLGIPAGFVMLIAEILISYSRNKEARAKLENLIPKRDTSRDVSFPDLQNTVGGKRQDGASPKYEYTYTSNGSQVSSSGSTGTRVSTSGKTEPQKMPEAYARPVRPNRMRKVAAAACYTVSGLTFFTAVTEIADIISLYGLDRMTEFAETIPMLLVSIAALIAGLWLTISKQKEIDKENRYIAIINQGYGMIPIDNICHLYPKTYDVCVQELQEMINKGTLPGAYIDYGRRLLVLDPQNSSIEPLIAPAQPAEKGVKAAGKSGGKEAASRASGSRAEDEKIDFLSLERLSREVSDEDIKMKLMRISSTLKTIGQKAEEDPQIMKAAGVDTFMDMYLPRTIALVRQYEEVDRAAALPEDNELKNNILETLDAIDNAAMTLWKDIIHSDMIDISSELDALQTKLMMDGYTESELKADQSDQSEQGSQMGADVFDQLRRQREKTPEKEE